MTWIAPNNATLDTVTGFYGGMGLNPWPTFDWNNLTIWLSPLTVPTFSIINMFVGILIGAIMTLIAYYKNAWNTGYLPINGNDTYDNTGGSYKISSILDAAGDFDNAKFQAYSQPWMSAGYVISYLWYFAMYSATFTYVAIYHWRDIALAYGSFKRSIRRSLKRSNPDDEDEHLAEDIHYKLMQAYPEVPEWQYLIVLLLSMVFGMIGVGIYPTHTSPVVLIFGIIMPLIVMIPCGLIQAVTGVPVPLNVLAEFIGGSLVAGNANALMYFKTYGYIAVYQALAFSNDLKLAHYLKVPPRATFYMQLWATMIYCLVSTSIFNFAMGFKDVCTKDAQFRFTCPNQRTFYSAAIFWGTISPKRLFGSGCRYNWMLAGFPLGVIMVLAYWVLRRRFPRSEWLRQVHPVMIATGPATWGSPYNMSYYIGNVYVVLFSFQYLRKRYPGFWAKYNYVVAAAFPAGIAVSALVIFFALAIPKGGLSVDWWGNSVTGLGCEGNGGCPRLVVEEGGYFGPAPGHYT
jgi:OPT family small oligopeptide transporter